jgi:hypothetical protein
MAREAQDRRCLVVQGPSAGFEESRFPDAGVPGSQATAVRLCGELNGHESSKCTSTYAALKVVKMDVLKRYFFTPRYLDSLQQTFRSIGVQFEYNLEQEYEDEDQQSLLQVYDSYESTHLPGQGPLIS